jgi:tyrosyl-tRNA synthetase
MYELMKNFTDELLNREIIDEVLPSLEEFRERLFSGKKMKFFWGADPTSGSLHLGHAQNIILLEEFRKLGHEVYVLFGDTTACIGNPNKKDSPRSTLTKEKAKDNAEKWVNKMSTIIDFNCDENPARVVYNSTWFDRFTATDLLNLFSKSTVQQLIERDMFQKRISQNNSIFLNEFVYPLFQSYDSVALDADAELCGTDNIFNALLGRELQKKINSREKFVIAVKLLQNPMSGSLMSFANNNGVFLEADPKTFFSQIMAQPYEMMEVILSRISRIPLYEVSALKTKSTETETKLFTAKTLTQIFYGEKAASEEYNDYAR